MKKSKHLVLVVLAFMLLFTVTACGKQPEEETSHAEPQVTQNEAKEELSDSLTDKSTEDTIQENGDGDTDILVVYFSRTGEQYDVGVIDEGNTAIVAKMIAELTGADTFEILPVDDHYPMTYDELTDVAKREQNDNARPEYAGEVPDLSKYSVVFIGAPVWWGDWPMICYTFFENEDLSEKTLYPFSTHAGSGLSGFDRKLADVVSGSTIGEGFSVLGAVCQNDTDSVKTKVNEWLAGLGY